MKLRVVVSAVLLAVMITCPAFSATNESYIIGSVKDGLYTNKSLGVEAYFGENWKILSREEIAELNGAVVSESPTFEEITNGDIPSFFAMTKDGVANIAMAVNNLGVMGSVIVSKSRDKMLDALIEYASDNLIKFLNEMECTGTTIGRSSVIFADMEQLGVVIETHIQGITMYMKQVICLKGEYSYHITVSSIGYDITDKLLDMFHSTESR